MAALKVSICGVDAGLSVRRFDVREQLSGLFTASIEARSERADLDLDEAVFKAASFSMTAGWAYVRGGGARRFTGLCCSIRQVQAEPSGLSSYAIEVVPSLWLLTLREDYRIFQDVAIPDILKEVLDLFSIDHDFCIGRGTYPRLRYKVQYGETDFAFLCRLCEEAGITFWFRDDEVRGSVLVLSDAVCAAPPREGGPLPYVDNPSAASEREYITRVRLHREGRPGAVTLRDYDFRNPGFPLYARSARADSIEKRLEVFRYVPGAFRAVKEGLARAPTLAPTPTPLADKGGAAVHDPEHGQRHAERMLAGRLVGSLGLSFRSNALDVAPGAVFAMTGHPHPRLDDGRTYLVTHLRTRGKHGGEWTCSGKAVLTEMPYRPPQVTAKPVAHGLQSAVVTGPKGREIFTDEHGRVRVQFPWDREGEADEHSSCWIRVAQGWAGAGFGLWTVPRVGQEVLVGFLEGDPDEPVIIGRAPNAHNPPPYPLPANETKSVWRSQSTPGGDGWNEISFEDRRGEERIYEKAQKDKETLVQGGEWLTVGGNRAKLVKRGEDIVVVAERRELVGQTLHITIKGDRREHVEGSKSGMVDGDQNEAIGGRYGLAAGAEVHITAGGQMVLEAASITLKSAGGFLTLNEGGAALDGKAVFIQQGGAPGVGGGCAPAAPVQPAMAAALFPTPPANAFYMPMFGFTPVVPMNIGPDPEMMVICKAICDCQSARKPSGRRGAQDCVTARLRAYDATLGGKSTIKAEVAYDMSKKPPDPIMSKNHPGPTTGKPAGSRVPDVTLVYDGSKPIAPGNIKKIIEIKFPPDKLSKRQRERYKKIAGSAPVEEWGPDYPCYCKEKVKQPATATVSDEDMLAIFMMALGVALLLLDDLIPGGQADDVLIPPLIVKLVEKLAPLLVMLGPVVPPLPPPTPMPTSVPSHEGEFDDE